MKEQIIKFIDKNIDGCGTDVEVWLKIKGPIVDEDSIVENLRKVITATKSSIEDWDTDTVLDACVEYLKEQYDFECEYLSPEIEIEF